VTASDLEAGYAADGYARTKGLGAVSVSYGVGTLSMINAIAGAYVERSPVVVINGGPTDDDIVLLHDVIFSHSIGQPATDLNAYKLVTASAARASTAQQVPGVVDNAIRTALTKKRPVYIEINKEIWTNPCDAPVGSLTPAFPPTGNEASLAVTIVGLLRAAQRPLILIGEEVQRYTLAAKAMDLITALGVPWASSLLAKSTLPEQGKGWVGVYDPPHSLPAIRTAVQGSDLLLTLGCVYPNAYAELFANTGVSRVVQVYDGKVSIKGAAKKTADLGALVKELVTEAQKKPAKTPPPGAVPIVPGPATGPLTYKQVIERIGVALDNTLLAIPDTFLGIYASANLPVQGQDAFLCSAVWASIGHSVAAAVGASFGSTRRPIVICGDGGFHMTATALSTMVQANCKPIVVVIDNGIYGYEQFLIGKTYFTGGTAAKPYVKLNGWDFAAFGAALGIPSALSVNTAAALDAALVAAKASAGPALIAAKVDPHGLPANLP
jgi:indolepyruvate decarboxylase